MVQTIKAHGGEIKVQATEDEYSEFIILFTRLKINKKKRI